MYCAEHSRALAVLIREARRKDMADGTNNSVTELRNTLVDPLLGIICVQDAADRLRNHPPVRGRRSPY